jgi:AsmA family protein
VRLRRVLIALAIVILLPVALVAAAVLFAQSEWAERWLETRISQRIERDVQIEGIDIDLGWPPVVKFERLRIGNPSWAKTPNLVDALGLAARVEIPPLFRRRIVIPYLGAASATAGLERDEERATWRFGSGEREPSPFVLHRVYLEDGVIVFRDEEEKTALDIKVNGSLGQQGELNVVASGRFRDEPAKATARIPSLEPSPTTPIQLVANATVGKTQLAAEGTVASDLDTLDLKLKLAGQSLKELRKVFGMNLPDTPPYRVAGHLRHTGTEWVFEPFEGRMGDSDLQGASSYRTGGKRPLFRANLKSKLLDLDDLGPVIGTPLKTGPGETASAEQKRKAAELAATTRVLPRQRISTAGWDTMDADVRLDAKRVMRPKQLPLDALSVHAVLNDSVLRLEPLSFTFADGKVSGPVTVNAREKPARGDVQLDIQGLQLSRLFPELESTKQSIGTLYGRAKLAGRGDSIADLLASSNGQLTFAIDGGRFSLLLVELLGIDIAEALRLLGTRNRQVTLRCAVGDFTVKDGIATPQAFVIDTTDTVVAVVGTIDFKQERMDLVFHAEPKDMSIFALRSPIHLVGPFKGPKARPEAGPIIARVAGAALLAAINPALAILPFIETGPGKDSDCAKLIAQAQAKGAVKKSP